MTIFHRSCPCWACRTSWLSGDCIPSLWLSCRFLKKKRVSDPTVEVYYPSSQAERLLLSDQVNAKQSRGRCRSRAGMNVRCFLMCSEKRCRKKPSMIVRQGLLSELNFIQDSALGSTGTSLVFHAFPLLKPGYENLQVWARSLPTRRPAACAHSSVKKRATCFRCYRLDIELSPSSDILMVRL